MSADIELRVRETVAAGNERLDQLETVLNEVESQVQRLTAGSTRLASMAAVAAMGANADPAEAVERLLDSSLAPIEGALTEASEALSESAFAGTADDVFETVVGNSHDALASRIDEISEGLKAAAEGVSEAIERLREHATSVLDATQLVGAEVSEEAKAQHEVLIERLRELVPQFAEQVESVMAEHLSNQISGLSEGALKSLDDLERLVDQVAGDLVDKLGGPARVLEQITNVVDELESLFNIFDAV